MSGEKLVCEAHETYCVRRMKRTARLSLPLKVFEKLFAEDVLKKKKENLERKHGCTYRKNSLLPLQFQKYCN